MMSISDVEKRIAELEEKIAEYPRGYISVKHIGGKERYYRQWTEHKKKKSMYVRESEISEMRALLDARRKLQAEVKELKAQLPKPEKKRRTKNVKTQE